MPKYKKLPSSTASTEDDIRRQQENESSLHKFIIDFENLNNNRENCNQNNVQQSEPIPDFHASTSSPQNLDIFSLDDFQDDDSNEAIPPTNNNYAMTEFERTIILLLYQTLSNSTNVETQLLARSFNNMYRQSHEDAPCFSSTSYEFLLKKFPHFFTPTIVKFFYANCGDLIGPVQNLNVVYNCPKICCQIKPKDVMYSAEAIDYFVYVSLEQWLQYLVPLLWDSIQLDYPHESKLDLHDLKCGQEYKRIVIDQKRLNAETLTLTLTWDGIACSKSVWPLIAYINELPFNKRINNPMLLALQCSNAKPKHDLMLKPLVDELIRFEREPIKININGEEKQFYVRLLLVIADAPARAALLRIMSHNSTYPCNICTVKGEYKTQYGCMTFPPLLSTSIKARMNKKWKELANKPEEYLNRKENIDEVKGVRGKSQLMRLPYINLPIICPPEIMHSQFLGTIKTMFDRWFTDRFQRSMWYREQKREKNYILSSISS
ncbi:hypothetical protein BLA29_001947, partial [Euroglyphus maynei]